MKKTASNRRYDLDWLRVITILAVFIFHNCRLYDTGGWHVKSPTTYAGMDLWTGFLGSFIMPLIFLISNDNQTVPVALGILQGQRLMDATTTSASALIGILPAMIFFVVFQRTLTRGIMSGAVK